MRARISSSREADFGGCLMICAWGALTVLGAVTFYPTALRPIYDIARAKTWVATQCAVVSSQLVEEGSGPRVEVVYTYEVDGKTHRGDRLDFNRGTSLDRAVLAAIVDAHPVGTELDCYFDPDDPARSVIDRSLGTFLWWGLLPLAFLAIGAGGLIFFLIVNGVIPYRGARRSS